MKKKYTLLLAALLFGILCQAQDAKEILKTSFTKCKEVKSGSYEMTYKWKPMTAMDTSVWNIMTDFVKIKNDSIFPFKYRYFYPKYNSGNWYTGTELIEFHGKDSTATIASNILHADYTQSIKHNWYFFGPITNPDKFFSEKVFPDSTTVYTYLGRAKMNDKNCYKIKIRLTDDVHIKGEFSTINQIIVMYINEDNYLPVRYDRDLDVLDAQMVGMFDNLMSYTLVEITCMQ